MGLFEILLLSVGLAMDAFAVSVCKGLAAGKASVKEYLLCGGIILLFIAIHSLITHLDSVNTLSDKEAIFGLMVFTVVFVLVISLKGSTGKTSPIISTEEDMGLGCL